MVHFNKYNNNNNNINIIIKIMITKITIITNNQTKILSNYYNKIKWNKSLHNK